MKCWVKFGVYIVTSKGFRWILDELRTGVVPRGRVEPEPNVSPLGSVLWYITHRTKCMGTNGILQKGDCAALNGAHSIHIVKKCMRTTGCETTEAHLFRWSLKGVGSSINIEFDAIHNIGFKISPFGHPLARLPSI